MAGFDVDFGPGRLAFANGYIIPNHAVRLAENATIGLWLRNLVGDDVEVVDGIVFYPKVSKESRADLALEVSQHANSSGTAAVNQVRQLKENLAELATIADLTETTGAQSVTYTPWVGATPIVLTASVLPPLEGAVIRGIGVRAGILMTVEEAVSGAGP